MITNKLLVLNKNYFHFVLTFELLLLVVYEALELENLSSNICFYY